MPNPSSRILALDVGERRIGVASAGVAAGIASPLTTVVNGPDIMQKVRTLLAEQDAVALVLGLPRGLDGQETAQTRVVENFAAELQKHIDIPLHWQDEALTSVKAKLELDGRGGHYAKGEIDALAATYILEDFLREHPQETRS